MNFLLTLILFTAMSISPGTYRIAGSTFTIDGTNYLLRERPRPTKRQPKFYLVALPNQYLSSLWPQPEGRFRIDFRSADDIERIFYFDFAEPGFVTITGGDPSRRSGGSAPWHRRPLPPRHS